MTVTDDDGDSGTEIFQFVIVYDPSAGFVTGGGWIYSEAGNYLPDLNLEGNATFGFVSKYKKGASVPTGNTEFQFHAGDLNFHSTSYDWLVVTGSDYTRYKGTGTINGDGEEYKFQIWAGDDETDTFRIKIWEEIDGVEMVVYDNGSDQAIGRGNIVVTRKEQDVFDKVGRLSADSRPTVQARHEAGASHPPAAHAPSASKRCLAGYRSVVGQRRPPSPTAERSEQVVPGDGAHLSRMGDPRVVWPDQTLCRGGLLLEHHRARVPRAIVGDLGMTRERKRALMSQNPAVNRFTTEPIICAVMGLGYVGLPLAVTIAEAGLDVIGFDIDEAVVSSLLSGRSNTVDIADTRLSSALESRLTLSSDGNDLSRADAVFICVPSPLGSHREPDLSFIRSAARILASVAKPGLLVSLESTTYPGTTSEVLVPALTSDSLNLDTDLFVAFSPERVSPASDVQLKAIPKVVGGVTETSSAIAATVYRRFIDSVHVVSSAENAEFTKLLENTYRAVNIALMNELAQFADRIGVDVWEAIDAATTKPFGFTAFHPGPGVGGHCIPLDPQYLAWRAREVGSSLTFIDTAERVNGGMPEYVARRAVDILNERSKSVRGAKILAVGIAYKPDVADDRESASIEVLQILHKAGAVVHVVDPYIDDDRIRMHGFTPAGEHTDSYDLAIILTDHSGIEYGEVANSAKAVFDTRNVYGRLGLNVSGINVL